jgi:hypothetical protein
MHEHYPRIARIAGSSGPVAGDASIATCRDRLRAN